MCRPRNLDFDGQGVFGHQIARCGGDGRIGELLLPNAHTVLQSMSIYMGTPASPAAALTSFFSLSKNSRMYPSTRKNG